MAGFVWSRRLSTGRRSRFVPAPVEGSDRVGSCVWRGHRDSRGGGSGRGHGHAGRSGWSQAPGRIAPKRNVFHLGVHPAFDTLGQTGAAWSRRRGEAGTGAARERPGGWYSWLDRAMATVGARPAGGGRSRATCYGDPDRVELNPPFAIARVWSIRTLQGARWPFRSGPLNRPANPLPSRSCGGCGGGSRE